VTPSLQARIDEQLALRVHAVGPVYGHLKLETAGHLLDVLIGGTTRINPGVSTLDWKTAPLAEVFFSYAEGEDYEIEIGDRSITGRLIQKNVLTWKGEELVRLECAEGTAVRTGDRWDVLADPGHPHLKSRAPAARLPFRSPLDVDLDPAQQRIVELSSDAQTLILGEAGFGKTTVALHRLLALKRQANEGFRAAVIVPTHGLRRLTQLMLERKGERDIEVWTYDQWAVAAARKAFPDLPHRESEGTSAEVIQFKRHGAIEGVLADFALDHPSPAQDEDRPSRSKARATRADLEVFFGDSSWMNKVVLASGGALAPRIVKELTLHTRVQFRDPAETEYAHVDQANLMSVDGRRLDDGTPNEDAGSIDPEDYAVMFELARLRALGQRMKPLSLATYDALLVDEAQEFAPLELRLLGRSLNPRGSVIVAGDAAQQVDPTSHFAGWDKVMEELGAAEHVSATLEVSYRCPPEVTTFARSLIDQGPPPPWPAAAITRALHDNGCHLALWLTEELQRIRQEDPAGSIAVVCRSDLTAKNVARTLNHGVTVRLALDGDFEFTPGITVTSVQEVKGLEFDCVVVPDAQASTYPQTPASRRSLYVAVTRATHHLGLAAVGRWFE
jgi:DNA helicase-2/ATP-dependent DNA helicase PcrA